MDKEENLKKMLDRLNKCKGLSKEDLAGKYKKAFEQLKHDIKKCATELLYDIILENLRWNDIDIKTIDVIADEVNVFLRGPAGKSIMKEISHSLYKKCSFDDYKAEALKIREQVKCVVWKHVPKEWTSIEMEVTK